MFARLPIISLLLLSLSACENHTARDHAYATRDRIMPGAPCVWQDVHEGDDTTFCTDGTTLLICIDRSPCITVHVAAEIAPR